MTSSSSFYISTKICECIFVDYLIRIIFFSFSCLEMRTVKLIEIASDWPPYLVISPLLLAFAKDPNGRMLGKIAFYIYFSSSFFFFYFLSFSFPYLKKKRKKIPGSTVENELWGNWVPFKRQRFLNFPALLRFLIFSFSLFLFSSFFVSVQFSFWRNHSIRFFMVGWSWLELKRREDERRARESQRTTPPVLGCWIPGTAGRN